MAEGKEVAIPNIGRFIESDGKVKFVTDDNFKYTPASIPTIKNSKQLDEQNSRLSHKPSYPPPAKADSVNWSMVILVVVLIVILAGAGYFIYDYTTKNNAEEVAVPVTETIAPPPVVAPVTDTVAPQVDTVDSAAAVVVDTTLINNYKIVIGNYRTKDRAEKRVKNLSLNGNKVEMVQKDTASFLVIAPISCRVIDTVRVKDSLKKMFGFQGVMIYK